ncbi:MAG TPA: molybdate ABC transporter substrate-binding protein, partial [Thermoanaerobaculia bacterium]|nr:molybdate ABC transporter substrate-binding protein [Thermoanaerobaculia bacterium]
AVPGSRFTYARGRLVLWSARAGAVTGPEALQGAAARPIALANPRIAPYGSAALTALERLGLADRLRPRLVYGQDVGQVFQFVATGNAEAGFVALAQVLAAGGAGSWWLVPERLYEPLEQQAVLLRRGGDNPAAHAAVAFLRGEEGRRRIAAAGYGLPEP